LKNVRFPVLALCLHKQTEEGTHRDTLVDEFKCAVPKSCAGFLGTCKEAIQTANTELCTQHFMKVMDAKEECKYDDLNALEQLRNCSDLKYFLLENEEKVSFFEVNPAHMTKTVAAPLTVKQTEGCSWNDILEIFAKTDISAEAFQLWKGYQEGHLFNSKAEVKGRLDTYTYYLTSDLRCAGDVKNMANCIAYEMKNFPEKYDAAGILMALGQNGGVCNVQKEIGIRMVYAAMMDSMMEHMKENSVETKVLSLLKKNRFVLSELVAEALIFNGKKSVNVFNSHNVIPVQNSLAAQIGIDHIPDPDGGSRSFDTAYAEFMKRYTLEHILKVIAGAVNDSHRLINYHDCVEFFEQIKPEGLDSYVYLNDFVFDMNTGKFTNAAMKYMLWKLDIIKVSEEALGKNTELLQKQILKPIVQPSKEKLNPPVIINKPDVGRSNHPVSPVAVIDVTEPKRRQHRFIIPVLGLCTVVILTFVGLYVL
jgi:hypothetical protein